MGANIVRFARWVSFDYLWIEGGIYIFILGAGFYFLGIPIIKYRNRPSIPEITKALKGDLKALKKVRTALERELEYLLREEMNAAFENSRQEGINWITQYFENQIAGFDRIIRQFAFKLTATVMISPNSVIDGLTLIFGNARLLHTLSQRIKIRYSLNELWQMYFSIFSIASLSGVLEEFDDEIEDMVQEFIEEFSEIFEAQTGKTLGDSIPFLGVVVKTISPILQAAGNYAFIIYNGNRFKYRVLAGIAGDGVSEETLRKRARKDARKARFRYIEVMIRNLGKKSANGVKEKISFFKRKS